MPLNVLDFDSPVLPLPTSPNSHLPFIIAFLAAFWLLMAAVLYCYCCCCSTDDDESTSSSSTDFRLEQGGIELEVFRATNPATLFEPDPNGQAEAECSICITRFEPRVEVRRLVECGHVFHSHCLDTWVASARTPASSCPLCRRPLV